MQYENVAAIEFIHPLADFVFDGVEVCLWRLTEDIEHACSQILLVHHSPPDSSRNTLCQQRTTLYRVHDREPQGAARSPILMPGSAVGSDDPLTGAWLSLSDEEAPALVDQLVVHKNAPAL